MKIYVTEYSDGTNSISNSSAIEVITNKTVTGKYETDVDNDLAEKLLKNPESYSVEVVKGKVSVNAKV